MSASSPLKSTARTLSITLLILWLALVAIGIFWLALPEFSLGLIQHNADSLRTMLMFDRSDIASGEWWRLLTGQLVHLTTPHALGNMAGLGLVSWMLIPRAKPLEAASLTLLCGVSVGIGLYWGAPDLQRYVGFSGLLHGLLIAAPFLSRRLSTGNAWIFAVLVTLKVLFEQTPWYDDAALMGYIGGRVEPRSHLFGMIGGWVWLALRTASILSFYDHLRLK